MSTRNEDGRFCEKCLTRELRNEIRNFGVLIYRALIGNITERERAELERLSIDTPATLNKVCHGDFRHLQIQVTRLQWPVFYYSRLC